METDDAMQINPENVQVDLLGFLGRFRLRCGLLAASQESFKQPTAIMQSGKQVGEQKQLTADERFEQELEVLNSAIRKW